jgi:hypothetical protein
MTQLSSSRGQVRGGRASPANSFEASHRDWPIIISPQRSLEYYLQQLTILDGAAGIPSQHHNIVTALIKYTKVKQHSAYVHNFNHCVTRSLLPLS